MPSACWMALDGCDCRELSGPATLPCAPISAIHSRPSSSALALLITTTAAAPSEICEDVPAVIVPSLAKAGRSLPSDSAVVSRADALVLAEDDRVALALRDLDRGDLGLEEAVLLRGRGPLVGAARRTRPARHGRCRGGCCASRWTRPWRCSRRRRSGRRAPWRRASRRRRTCSRSRDFGSRCGALVMDSWPPATTTSNSPARISWSASAIASRPERHTLLIVSAGTFIGMPALTAAWRAGICPAPACSTWPMITYCTWSPPMPARSSAALMAKPPSSAPEKVFSEPSSRPSGVRAPATITEVVPVVRS